MNQIHSDAPPRRLARWAIRTAINMGARMDKSGDISASTSIGSTSSGDISAATGGISGENRGMGGISAGMGIIPAIIIGVIIAAHGTSAFAEKDIADAHDIEQSGAVIFVYHRFDEAHHPSTQIDTALFARQIDILVGGDYHILPLIDIVHALGHNRQLPINTIAITIDDAYASFFAHGWPILEKMGLPFTLFVSTDAVDGGYRDYMTWEQIRIIAQSPLATIGNHSAGHSRLRPLAARDRHDIVKAHRRLTEETGQEPRLYSYPYGQYDPSARDVLAQYGYLAAFGQYSSVADGRADIFYLPRFAINQHYGQIDRFRLISRALPLAVTVRSGIDAHTYIHPPSPIVLDVDRKIGPSLHCYAPHQPTLDRHGRELRLYFKPWPEPQRSWPTIGDSSQMAVSPSFSLNCTALAETIGNDPDPTPRWHWWGRALRQIQDRRLPPEPTR